MRTFGKSALIPGATLPATYDPVTGETVSVREEISPPSVAVIQTKWETPILNFKNVSKTSPTYGVDGTSLGMWHQYGVVPGTQEGVFLEIQDLTDAEKNDPELTGSLAELMG